MESYNVVIDDVSEDKVSDVEPDVEPDVETSIQEKEPPEIVDESKCERDET